MASIFHQNPSEMTSNWYTTFQHFKLEDSPLSGGEPFLVLGGFGGQIQFQDQATAF